MLCSLMSVTPGGEATLSVSVHIPYLQPSELICDALEELDDTMSAAHYHSFLQRAACWRQFENLMIIIYTY